MNIITLRSPAKINLTLNILNKREDGFHNLETLFQRISLFDVISLKSIKNNQIKIICNHPQIPKGPKNLIYKVAKRLKEQFGIQSGVTIKLTKNIPVAAGLGGGSSNAAITLLGLNRLWRLGLSKKELIKIAADIGSDVPFFLMDSAYCLGFSRGEILRKVDIKSKFHFVLVTPKVKVYTKDVFKGLKLKAKKRKLEGMKLLTKSSDDVSILIHKLKQSSILEACSKMNNDLERVTLKICPRLNRLKKMLNRQDLKGVMVSGSGPSVFGIADSLQHAKNVVKHLKKSYSQVYLVRTY